MVEVAVVPSRGWRVSSRGEEVFTDFFDSLWSQCCCRHVGGEAVESGGIVAHVRCSLCRCHSTLWDRGWCLEVVADRCLVVVVVGCCCLVAVLGGVLIGVPDGVEKFPDLSFFDHLVARPQCV